MITEDEFRHILSDSTKRIGVSITWSDDEDHSPARQFAVPVDNDEGHPLHINGWYNAYSGKLSFTLIRGGTGRIYGLDFGAGHHNPTCETIDGTHKHHWTEAYRDKLAYVPADITAEWDDPGTAWQQFCAEANIQHHGDFGYPEVQGGLI